MGKIVIAIDGYSGCGKSSTAKAVAKDLGFTYIDSGAMYRAATLHFLNNFLTVSFTSHYDSPIHPGCTIFKYPITVAYSKLENVMVRNMLPPS